MLIKYIAHHECKTLAVEGFEPTTLRSQRMRSKALCSRNSIYKTFGPNWMWIPLNMFLINCETVETAV